MKNFLTPFFIFLFFLVACEKEFNTNFPTPEKKAKVIDVFPKSIEKHKPLLKKLSLPFGLSGFEGIYGETDYIIRIILFVKQESFSPKSYLEQIIFPLYKTKGKTGLKKEGGERQVSARTKDGSFFYAWTKSDWLMEIQVKDEKKLEILLKSFPYLSK
ncbi:MAG: hypothetical protein H7A25_00045 [Leptospiraceae bacterium]|nr:hypothetical protein [Leptospiraceae bacterium]MCP5498265.1 hypothetical protein [Leptospiraceae bacterium]